MGAFSHIYIENGAMEYPLAQAVLKKLPRAKRVMIGHHKDVFNRPRQDFRAQKGSQQLILARKRPPYLYPLSPLCETYGYEKAYYATPALNCPYDCDFCFLQGVYPSAHLVAFVNDDDFFTAVREVRDPFFLSITYENDLMAMEGLAPMVSRWMAFAKAVPHMEMEVRTRSAHMSAIQGRQASPNVVLAWSLSPPDIAARYEKKAPAPMQRIQAAKRALDAGWRVRLCFEPIIRIPDWEETYREFVEAVFTAIPADGVDSAVADVFRMGKEGFETIFKARADTDLFAFRPVEAEGGMTYPQYRCIGSTVRRILLEYLPEEKVYGGEWR